MAPSKWPKTVLSALLPMNQLCASTGIFSAYSENILGVQAAAGLFSADRFLQSLLFLAHGAGAELEVLGSFLGGSWHPCGRFPWAQSAMFAVSPEFPVSFPALHRSGCAHAPEGEARPCHQGPGDTAVPSPARPAPAAVCPAGVGRGLDICWRRSAFEGKHCVFSAAVPMRR